MTTAAAGPAARRRSPLARVLLGLLALATFAGLLALGTWQVQRRAWKLDLIARVEARIHAPPAPAPPPGTWAGLDARADAYRRITVRGRFLNDRETLVQAVTEEGPGRWVVTPLRTDEGWLVLVNRGFVPQDRSDPATRAAGQIVGEATVTGLLRPTEPGGGFLRHNDAGAGRWYSRDVAAIAAAQGLPDVAPYFLDADATPNPGGLPVGGLTVVRFRNDHLVYALTWYGMAALLAALMVLALRSERQRRADA